MTAFVQVLWSPPTVDRADPLWLDPAEARRLDRITRPESRREFLTSRVLVKSLVAWLAAVDPLDVRLGYTCALCGEAHGRPVVTRPDEATRVHVSLAHAGDRVVVAGSRFAPVGVDVEPVSATGFDGFDAVALTPAERRRLRRLHESQRRTARAAFWARKEALLKASGEGLNLDPAAVELTRAGAQLRDLDLGPGYAAAVAVLGSTPVEVAVRQVSALTGTALSAGSAGSAGPLRAATDAGAH
jgi:4'-phosphopantetheinyl transferase